MPPSDPSEPTDPRLQAEPTQVSAEVDAAFDAMRNEGAGPEVDVRLNEVRVLLKYHLLEHALGHLEPVLQQRPDHPLAVELLAQILAGLGRDSEAADARVDLAKQLFASHPSDAGEQVALALALAPDHPIAAELRAKLATEHGVEITPAERSEALPGIKRQTPEPEPEDPLPQRQVFELALDAETLRNVLSRARDEKWQQLALVVPDSTKHWDFMTGVRGRAFERRFAVRGSILRDSIDAIAACEELTALAIVGCGLRDEDVTPLAKLSRLRLLDLSFNDLRDATLSWIASLPGIDAVRLSHNHITDTGAERFVRDRRSASRFPNRAKIEKLDLSHNQLTDASARHLVANLADLNHLDLRGNEISFASEDELKSCDPRRLGAAYDRFMQAQPDAEAAEDIDPVPPVVECSVLEIVHADWSSMREKVRESAIFEARELIAAHLGRLEHGHVERLFSLFNTDHRGGHAYKNRFAPAFTGRPAKQLLGRLPALNRWTERLWTAPDDEAVARVLDELWTSDDLPGAGYSYPTVVLHVRDSQRYWPILPVLIQGYAALTGKWLWDKNGATYLRYVRFVRSVRERANLPTHAVDLFFYHARGVSEDGDAEVAPGQGSSAPDPATSESHALRVNLQLGLDGTCRAWIADGPPGSGVRLPDLHEFEGELDDAVLDSLGRELFAAAFQGEAAQTTYREARERARTVGAPLRIVLCMHPDEQSADSERVAERCTVAEHYWEALVDPEPRSSGVGLGRRLGTDHNLRLVRTRSSWTPRPSHPPRPGKFRVLVGFADPDDYQQLELHREWLSFNRLQRELRAASLLDMAFIGQLDLQSLRDELPGADLFHFAGHGEEGALVLTDLDQRSRLLTSEVLIDILTGPPRVVVLNCCHAANPSAELASIAEVFLEQGVSVVVAMSGEVVDAAALAFTDELYRRLVIGEDIEAAVQKARWRAFAEGTTAWFRPTLWTQAAASFALARPEPSPAVAAQRTVVEDRFVELRPRVMMLEQLELRDAARQLDGEQRREVAEQLVEQLEREADGADLETEIDKLLDHDHRLERSILRARRHAADPAAELRSVASTLRRELVPQLSSAVNNLPALLDTFESLIESRRVDVGPPAPDPVFDLTSDRPLATSMSLSELVAEAKGKLVLRDSIVRRCVLHLLAGRHLVLAGPPGTGKSTLARGLADAFGYCSEFATANPDWTTFDTIGGLSPVTETDRDGRKQVGYEVQAGCVLKAVGANWSAGPSGARTRATTDYRGTWLIIDEMNRAPLDLAFGDLFTALVSRKLRDPRSRSTILIPRDFRLLCTTNTSDRRLLFEFSEALKRRFAFVEIPAFVDDRKLGDQEALAEQLRERDPFDPAVHEDIAERFDEHFPDLFRALEPIIERVRILHPVGLAQVLDVLTYALVVRIHDPGARIEGELFDVALIDNLLPTLEARPTAVLEALASLLDGSIAGWFDGFAKELDRGYQLDAHQSRVAFDVLRGLRTNTESPLHERQRPRDIDGWQPLLPASGDRVFADMYGLTAALGFAGALRRLAAERDA